MIIIVNGIVLISIQSEPEVIHPENYSIGFPIFMNDLLHGLKVTILE